MIECVMIYHTLFCRKWHWKINKWNCGQVWLWNGTHGLIYDKMFKGKSSQNDVDDSGSVHIHFNMYYRFTHIYILQPMLIQRIRHSSKCRHFWALLRCSKSILYSLKCNLQTIELPDTTHAYVQKVRSTTASKRVNPLNEKNNNNSSKLVHLHIDHIRL